MAVITITDVEAYLGRVLTGVDVTACSAIIDMVTDEMVAFLGRDIEQNSFTESRYLWARSAPRSYIPLSHSPVQSITSVTVDGTALTSDQWIIERSGVELTTVNFPEPLTGGPPQATIVYTAGLGEPALSQLKNPIINRVARIMNRRQDDVFGARDASVEGYRILYQADEWADRELQIARKWKRRMVSRAPNAGRV
jgi:hypothetical protein